jgi:Ca-activated chloride channel family protein
MVLSKRFVSWSLIAAAGCGGSAQRDVRHAQTTAAAYPAMAEANIAAPSTDGNRYSEAQESDFVAAATDARSTFSLDVDTASYTLMRRSLREGRLPPPESVRIEEYVNFFRYDEEGPTQSADGAPFSVRLESAPSPFGGPGLNLLRVGVQAIEVPAEQRPAANLVFLIDVSGSMMSPDKLQLVQYALSTLIDTLRPDDTIGIVVYAGREAVLLEPTSVANRGTLLAAIESLQAGGSTNGAGGIRAAYDLASQHMRRGGINRVILCTDGDFNVGLTDDALVEEVARQRARGITLTVLGFGTGNLNDRFMEQLADRGNGNYAYIDSRNEALRVLSRDLGGTIQVVAKDVKVQVAFNPDVVERFRLIGYENRLLAHEDFDDDGVDAAEVGSGQFVTAYFEYELRPGAEPVGLADVRIRYQEPDGQTSREVGHAIDVRAVRPSFDDASPVFRFGAAVIELAEILRRSRHSEGARFDEVLDIARSATWSQSEDAQELQELVATAARLWRQQ